ncbi:hypothetical protein KSS87_003720, partial [Heliosperma pusillum]
MKLFYHLLLVILCICHPTLGRNSSSNNIQCIDRERDALLKFKNGIRIDNCGLLTSWVGDTDCCQWHGVRCSNVTGHVIMLRLAGEFPPDSNVCLEGDVSPSLGTLTHTHFLNLSSLRKLYLS